VAVADLQQPDRLAARFRSSWASAAKNGPQRGGPLDCRRLAAAAGASPTDRKAQRQRSERAADAAQRAFAADADNSSINFSAISS